MATWRPGFVHHCIRHRVQRKSQKDLRQWTVEDLFQKSYNTSYRKCKCRCWKNLVQIENCGCLTSTVGKTLLTAHCFASVPWDWDACICQVRKLARRRALTPSQYLSQSFPRLIRCHTNHVAAAVVRPFSQANTMTATWQTGHRLKNPAVWDLTLCRRGSSTRNSSWTTEPLKMKAIRSFETSGTTYPVTQRHIPEDRNWLHRYENLNLQAYRLLQATPYCTHRGW
jgi:hypothetical protein